LAGNNAAAPIGGNAQVTASRPSLFPSRLHLPDTFIGIGLFSSRVRHPGKAWLAPAIFNAALARLQYKTPDEVHRAFLVPA
jgi:hypothetical protein